MSGAKYFQTLRERGHLVQKSAIIFMKFLVILAMQKPKIAESSKVYFTSPLSNNVMHLQVGDSIVSNIGKRVMIGCRATGEILLWYCWQVSSIEIFIHRIPNVRTVFTIFNPSTHSFIHSFIHSLFIHPFLHPFVHLK